METKTQSQTTKLKFFPVHQTKEGIVTGELRTDGIFGGQFICNIEESNAKEIIKRNNMHNEALDVILEFVRESKSDTPLVKKAVELLNKDKD